jgi:hypothetical protein
MKVDNGVLAFGSSGCLSSLALGYTNSLTFPTILTVIQGMDDILVAELACSFFITAGSSMDLRAWQMIWGLERYLRRYSI